MSSGPLPCLAFQCLFSHQTTSNYINLAGCKSTAESQPQSALLGTLALGPEPHAKFACADGANLMLAKWGMDQIKHQWCINMFRNFALISLGYVSNLDNMQSICSCRDQGSAKTTLAVKRISAGHPRHQRWRSKSTDVVSAPLKDLL